MQRVEKCGLHLGLPTTRAFASPAAAGGEVSGECNCGATKCELLRVLPLRSPSCLQLRLDARSPPPSWVKKETLDAIKQSVKEDELFGHM